jgi:hypothetical protein
MDYIYQPPAASRQPRLLPYLISLLRIPRSAIK